MHESDGTAVSVEIPVFDREFFTGKESFTRIGHGQIGGKAQGLAAIHSELGRHALYSDFPGITVEIPRLSVITTQHFDSFMAQNDLYDVALSGDVDERIVHHFLAADLPADLTGDLWALIAKVHTPLAVRSSSLLEDSLNTPFAGIYETKMIANNEHDAESRFHKLVEAIKFVYASTFFKQAKAYARATGHRIEEEKMAVILQEVVGLKHGQRFYPNISGVGRSYNYYPTGKAQPQEGVVDLALGLGKTIVDGGRCWNYSPAHPRVNPPFNSMTDLLKQSQTTFWAVNMGTPEKHNPFSEAEYLAEYNLSDAEYDNVLSSLASTFDPSSSRLTVGTGRSGPRVLTFAPILHLSVFPLNQLIKTLLPICESSAGGQVEIEFAVTIDHLNRQPARFSLLQVRRMAAVYEPVVLDEARLDSPELLMKTRRVLGNGTSNGIYDIVYLNPESFDFSQSEKVVPVLERLNQQLSDSGRPYLLLGFGRWGSSDPWLGVPVKWPQISGAKVIVEAEHAQRPVDFSQGSHFFHNVSNMQIMYLSIPNMAPAMLDWEWLKAQPVVAENHHVRHVRLTKPLSATVSLMQGWGVVSR